MRSGWRARDLFGVLVVGLVVVLTAVAPAAAAPAPPPAAYYGSLTVDGEPAPAGLTVTAEIDGEVRGSLTTSEPGRYGDSGAFDPKLQVDGTDGDEGATVSFFVEGQPAGTTTWSSGDVRDVPLSATGVPASSSPGGGDSGSGDSDSDGSGPSGTPTPGGASTSIPEPGDSEPVVRVDRSGDGVEVQVTDARAGEEIVIDTDGDDTTGLDGISMTPLVDGSFSLALSQFDSPPAGTPPPPGGGTGVGFIQVDHSIPDGDIGGVTFRFRVEKDDLAERDLDPDDVTLYRLSDGTWTPLATTPVGETDASHTFEASSPGLSLFVIDRQAGASGTPTPTSTAGAPTSTTTETGELLDDRVEMMGVDRRTVLLGFGVLAVVLGGAVALRRRV